MNKQRQYGTIAGAMFAAALVATLAMVPIMDQQAFAKKPLDLDYDNAERILGFNLIGVPNAVPTEGKCYTNNSNNVYAVRGSAHEHILFVNTTASTVVDHCTDSVDGDQAVVDLDVDDLPVGDVVYTVRMLGKPGGELKFCSQTVALHGSDQCVIDVDPTETFLRDNGKPGFSMPKKLFDIAGEDQIWTSSINDDFRIAQIDVWVIPDFVA